MALITSNLQNKYPIYLIPIIAILAGMLLPALNNARQRAKSTQCMSQIKQVVTAVHFYMDDYNGYICSTDSNANGSNTWMALLTGKLAQQKKVYIPPAVLRCPAVQKLEEPSDLKDWPFGSSYGKNTYGMWAFAKTAERSAYYVPERVQNLGVIQGQFSPGLCGYLKPVQMRNTSGVVLLADCGYVVTHASFGYTYYLTGTTKALTDWNTYIWRIHLNRASCAFLDGHAALMDGGQLNALPMKVDVSLTQNGVKEIR